jgi:hypothetical protein
LQFGASVAGVGDVDADGYADFVIGAPAVTTTKTPVAHLYRGGPGGVSASAMPETLASDGSTGFASEVEPAGDVDGDGYADVLVTSASAVVLFRGGANGTAAGVSVAAGGQGANPRHARGCGDLDGDGRGDVIVGDGAGVEALFGTATGVDRARAITVTPTPALGAVA